MTKTIPALSFNLLHQPWIPVVSTGGEVEEVSLLRLLKDAEHYKEIVHDDPLVVVALHRYLLAFLHRALDGPREVDDAIEWLDDGFPSAAIEAYATKWETKFDLFHPEHPFGQHPGIKNEKFLDHWSRLQAARGSFNTNFLYSYDLRDKSKNQDETSPPEAVRQLLAHQHFALGGTTQRFVTSARASPYANACLTFVHGNNLLETLCLNLVSYDRKRNRENDRASWEQEPAPLSALQKGAVQVFDGLASTYTWNARSVLFNTDERGNVVSMYYAEGLSPDAKGYADPMVTLTRNSKGELYSLAYRQGRGLWRDLHSFVPTDEGNTAPEVISWAYQLLTDSGRASQQLSFSSVGLVKDSNKAKITMTRHELLRLPQVALKASALRQTLEQWSNLAKDEANLLSLALKTVAAGLLSKRRDGASPKKIAAQVDSFQFEALYWPAAESHFWALLDQLPGEAEEFHQRRSEFDEQWADTLRKLKAKTYGEMTRALEPTPETLRAVQLGHRTLWKGMNP